jgi:PAS domain S-box-containing protein
MIRESVGGFVTDLFAALSGDERALNQRMFAVSRERVGQGFSVSDYLRALFLTFPVARELAREVGPAQDASFARDFAELEDVLHRYAANAAEIYTAATQKQVEAKNLELNRVNQQLAARERAATAEAAHASRALSSANEFNQRVIESLSSGLSVIDFASGKVTLYTQRMAEILELPAEEILGRNGIEAFAPVVGLNTDKLVTTVRQMGRIPLTKVQITSARGRPRTVLLRVERMYGPEGNVEGTVIVVDDVSERELLIDSFSRYVSRDLLHRLLARGERPGLEAERQVCTILFADIRGFTTLAEQMTPEQLHGLLNDFLRAMIEGIVDAGGFIDKFVGDKVMALFMGRASVAESAAAAVAAALRIQGKIAKLSEERAARGGPPVRVGIGINTGEVLVGNVGSESRMDFTAIGDAVNVADRLQGLARQGEILIGQRTAELVGARFKLVERGEQPVKGRTAQVKLYEVQPS